MGHCTDNEQTILDAKNILERCNIEDLETRGFVLIRNCIPQSELNIMMSEYTNSPAFQNQNYNYCKSNLRKNLGDIVPDFISHAMQLISNKTDINCDTLLEGYYWPTGKNGVDFPWHQDHLPYYMNESNYNYLNFYIVIKKEKPEHGNLALIPFDSLSYELSEKLKGRGGTIFGPGTNVKDRTISLGKYDTKSFGDTGIDRMDSCDFVMRDTMTGQIAPIPVNFEDIKEVPHLLVGDMLIMRGDLIHRTGDTLCDRLALSFRCTKRSESIFSLKKITTLTPSIRTETRKKLPITTHKARVMFMSKQWIWMLAILAAKKSIINFADNPNVLEHSDWSILSKNEKRKCLIWYVYYETVLKKLYQEDGTLFWWSDTFE